jgi:hypothetical protein
LKVEPLAVSMPANEKCKMQNAKCKIATDTAQSVETGSGSRGLLITAIAAEVAWLVILAVMVAMR